jgi:hypothetical protein
MKSTGTDFWQPSNTDATNESGFSGLPGGERIGLNGNYEGALVGGKWWSASVNVPGSIWGRGLDQGGAVIYRLGGNNVRNGFCVRCVRD